MRKVIYFSGLRGSVWILNAWSPRVLSVRWHGNEALSHIHIMRNPGSQRRCPIFSSVCQLGME